MPECLGQFMEINRERKKYLIFHTRHAQSVYILHNIFLPSKLETNSLYYNHIWGFLTSLNISILIKTFFCIQCTSQDDFWPLGVSPK